MPGCHSGPADIPLRMLGGEGGASRAGGGNRAGTGSGRPLGLGLASVDVQALSIGGAYVCTPRAFADDRGVFLEWFRAEQLPMPMPLAQANHSVSRRGVLRGVHYADVPPGQAKYVYCPQGAVLDVVVDLRVGSPTFGR